MSRLQLRWLAIGVWVTAVTAFATALVAIGVSISGSAGIALLAAASIPPLLMTRIWRDPSPQTIAQVLHPIHGGYSNEDRPVSATKVAGRS